MPALSGHHMVESGLGRRDDNGIGHHVQLPGVVPDRRDLNS